jgi:hypothetical protein
LQLQDIELRSHHNRAPLEVVEALGPLAWREQRVVEDTALKVNAFSALSLPSGDHRRTLPVARVRYAQTQRCT